MALSVTEFIERFKELLETSDSIDDIKEKFYSWSGSIDVVATSAGKASEQLKNLTKSSTESGNSIGGFLGEKIEQVKAKLDNAGYSAKALAIAGAAVGLSFTRSLEGFNPFGKISTETSQLTMQIDELTEGLGKMGALDKGTKFNPLNYAAQFVLVGQAARNMENQMISNMAAAGELDELLKSVGGDFAGMSDKVLQFSNLTADVGNAVGMTSSQVATLANDLMKLPGVFNQVVTTTGKSADSIHMLEAAIKVARGTRLDFKDVQEDIIAITQRFGGSVQDSLETISKMSYATNSLGLNLQDMRRYVRDTGEQFKFFGNNSSSVLDIMAQFGPALRKSGLGPTAITELVQGFTTGIAKMNVAQRAFLASQTGIGGGGLRGGLVIEQMFEEGKAGEIATKLEETLTKLSGGRLLTREQAIVGGPGAAAQFEFQRQLLQQGPFGQLAGSPQEAAKLLEALAGGKTEEAAKLITGQEALTRTAQIGGNIAARQTDKLVIANNELAKISGFQSVVADQARRAVIGVDGIFGISKESLAQLQSISKGYASSKLSTGMGIEGRISPAKYAEQIADKLSDSLSGTILGPIKDLLKEKFKIDVEEPKKAPEAEKPAPVASVYAEGELAPSMGELLNTPPKLPPVTAPITPARAIAIPVKEAAKAAEKPVEQATAQSGQPTQQASMSQKDIIVKLVLNDNDVLRILKVNLDDGSYSQMFGVS